MLVVDADVVSALLVILALSLGFSSIVTVAAPQASPPEALAPPESAGPRARRGEDGEQKGSMTAPNTAVTDVTGPPLSPPSLSPPATSAAVQTCRPEAQLEKQHNEERVEEEVEERLRIVNEEPRKKPFWLDDDDLPPMM